MKRERKQDVVPYHSGCDWSEPFVILCQSKVHVRCIDFQMIATDQRSPKFQQPLPSLGSKMLKLIVFD